MNFISVPCPIDGRVETTSEFVVLHTFDSPRGKPYYTFLCPACRIEYRKPATSAICALLFPMVKSVVEHLPLEYAEENPQGPPITEEDIAEFLSELDENERLRSSRVDQCDLESP